MINDNGDFFRGLGFVAVYSADLEEKITEITELVKKISPIKYKEQFGIAKQTKSLLTLINRYFDLAPDYSSKKNDQQIISQILNLVLELVDKRNSAIHSVHRSRAGDIIQVDSRKKLSKTITSLYLIDLANKIHEARGELRRVINAIKILYKELKNAKNPRIQVK